MKPSYRAQGRTEMLRKRAKRCVCKYCGGPLRLKQLVFSEYDDARVEIFCRDCDRIEFGVEPEIYEIAQYFVEQTSFNHYPELDDAEQTKRMNIAKVCEIMSWENKGLGILGDEGFAVPVDKSLFLGECLHVTEDDLCDGEIECVEVGLPSE